MVGASAVARNITERKRAAQASQLLAEAGEALGASLDYESTLATLADLVVRRGLADWCVVDIREPGEAFRRAAMAHADPEKRRLIEQLTRRMADPVSLCGAATAWRRGEPVWMAELSEDLLATNARDEPHLQMLRELGLGSCIAVPLKARGQVLGVMTLIAGASGRRYGEQDVRFAQELAGRAALAMDNARLYDQTRQELAERRRAEERLRSIVDHAVDGIITIDETGSVEAYNPAAQRIFGYSLEEVVGRNVSMFVPQPDLSAGEAKIIGTGREGLGRRKDGTTFPIELAVSAFRLDDRRMFTGIVRDITERKRAEQALRDRERGERARADEMAALMDSVPALVWIAHDPECRRITGGRTARRVLRMSADDNLSQSASASERPTHFASYHHGRRLRPDQLPMQRAARGEEVRDFEEEVRFDDGTSRHLAGDAVPLYDDNGRPRGAVGAFIDITRRKQAEQELRELNETLEERVAERTVELEQRAAQLQQLTVDLTQAEQRERRRLARLLHDHHQQLLVAIKMQAGMLRQVDAAALPQKVERIIAMMDEAIESSRSLSYELSPQTLYSEGLGAALRWLATQNREKHGLTLHVDVDPSAEPVGEDARIVLFELARELLLNVVKHADTDEAWVETRQVEPDHVELAVADRGRGFDPDALSGDSSKPAGLGLTGMQERLAALGGELEVDSQPARGTRVTIRMPRTAAVHVEEPQ